MQKTCSGITRKGISHSSKYSQVKVKKTTKSKILSNEELHKRRINRFRRGTALSFEQAERLYYKIGINEFER